MTKLEEKMRYQFQNPDLLQSALTHSSYANEMRGGVLSNERLEFLGDSVLGFITADYLFHRFDTMPEGELTKLRAALVCEKSLHEFAQKLDLGEHLLLGRGEINTGGRKRPSILADAFEALLAAVFLDTGMVGAREYLLQFIEPALQDNAPSFMDHKTMLQEIIQKNPEEHLEYYLVGESGPDHDKTFVVEVRLNSNIIGKGTGHSKKQAEQEAAREALSLMGL